VDSRTLGESLPEQIVIDILEINKKIATAKAYRNHALYKIFYPKGWEEIECIDCNVKTETNS
jgi:site-specific recombinase XerD